MILSYSKRFKTSEYHQEFCPESANMSSSEGLVIEVDVHFEHWLDGRWAKAEAFVDPGADSTIFSLRWIGKLASENHLFGGSTPALDPYTRIREDIIIKFDNEELRIPRTRHGPKIGRQGAFPEGYKFVGKQLDNLLTMPGYEDVLLGRDFLVRHQLMLVVDGDNRKFSMLYPIDAENRKRRKAILGALDPEEPCPPS